MSSVVSRWRLALLPVLMGMLLFGRLAAKNASSGWLLVFASLMLAIGFVIGLATWRASKLENA